MLGRFKGCLLAAALGDALGSLRGRGASILRYTDDTSMMLALAESIVEKGGVDPHHLAQKFAENYWREPWRGYGPGPPRIFKMIRERGVSLCLDRLLYPGGSYGNGCAMRVAPVALLYHDDPQKLRRAVEDSCKPTHSHPLGVEGALLEAAAISTALRVPESGKVDARLFLEELRPYVESKVYLKKIGEVERLLKEEAGTRAAAKILGNTVEAFNSVPTAIYIYLKTQDPVEAIRLAIAVKGDTDTIACMAAAIAGAHRGVDVLSSHLLERLEDRERIERLAEALWRLKQG